jgi:hypothetical protein|tara:strand:- start:215 stop:487 length:273 start_codon:yes stop_codon:yes gene_type:complete
VVARQAIALSGSSLRTGITSAVLLFIAGGVMFEVFSPCIEVMSIFRQIKKKPSTAFQKEIDIQQNVREKSKNITISKGVIPFENKTRPVR